MGILVKTMIKVSHYMDEHIWCFVCLLVSPLLTSMTRLSLDYSDTSLCGTVGGVLLKNIQVGLGEISGNFLLIIVYSSGDKEILNSLKNLLKMWSLLLRVES